MKKAILTLFLLMTSCGWLNPPTVDYLQEGASFSNILSGTTWVFRKNRQEKIIQFNKQQQIRVALSQILGTEYIDYQVMQQSPQLNVITFLNRNQNGDVPFYFAFQFLNNREMKVVSWQSIDYPGDSIVIEAIENSANIYKLSRVE